MSTRRLRRTGRFWTHACIVQDALLVQQTLPTIASTVIATMVAAPPLILQPKCNYSGTAFELLHLEVLEASARPGWRFVADWARPEIGIMQDMQAVSGRNQPLSVPSVGARRCSYSRLLTLEAKKGADLCLYSETANVRVLRNLYTTS